MIQLQVVQGVVFPGCPDGLGDPGAAQGHGDAVAKVFGLDVDAVVGQLDVRRGDQLLFLTDGDFPFGSIGCHAGMGGQLAGDLNIHALSLCRDRFLTQVLYGFQGDVIKRSDRERNLIGSHGNVFDCFRFSAFRSFGDYDGLALFHGVGQLFALHGHSHRLLFGMISALPPGFAVQGNAVSVLIFL